MLRIQPKQLTTFQAMAMRDFEDRMLEHIKAFSPRHSRVLSPEQLRGVIQGGLTRARAHGFTSERSIRYWVELSLMLGSAFATDPLLPWVQPTLTRSSSAAQAQRIDALRKRGWQHVGDSYPDLADLVSGGPRRVLELLGAGGGADVEELPSESAILAELRVLLPRRLEIAGDDRAHAAIGKAIASAERSRMGTQRGARVFVAMSFTLGSGFAADPLLPWLPPLLDDPSPAAPLERVERLVTEAITSLRRWWS